MPPDNKPPTGLPAAPPANPSEVDVLKNEIAELKGMVKLLSAQQTTAAPSEEIIEDGPCDPVVYFSKDAELRFSCSVGGKTMVNGKLTDPIPETYEFHGNALTLNTKRRIYIAETYGPFPGNKAGRNPAFFRTTVGQKVTPANEVKYTQGPQTTAAMPGQKPQNN